MYKHIDKIGMVIINYRLLKEELVEKLKEAIVNNETVNFYVRFTSELEPFISVGINSETDFYDDIIFTAHEDESFDIFEYFNDDLSKISEITEIPVYAMRYHAAVIMDCSFDEIDDSDIIIVLGASTIVRDALEKERKRIIMEDKDKTVDVIAENILSTYISYSIMKNMDENGGLKKWLED